MTRTRRGLYGRARAALFPVALATALVAGLGAVVVAHAEEPEDPTEVDPRDVEPPAGRVPYEEVPPDDSSDDDSDDDLSADDPMTVNPLDLYLQDLSDSTASTFSDPALDSLSISDAEVDSLMRVYAATGKSPAAPTAAQQWKFKLGIADARYNRVEGFNVSPQVKIRPPVSPPLEFRGWVGYGWSASEFTGGGEMRAQMARQGRPTLHVSWAREVYSFGSGLVVGNSLTSLVFGNDYGDYFRAEGWRFGIEATPGRFFVDATVRMEAQESLQNAAAFSVFENDESFRANPPIDDGDLRSVELIGSWLDHMDAPWTARARLRIAGGALGGDFDYERVRGELIARRRVWLGDRVVAAVAGGWIAQGAPFQALHHLGGFETLRGYDINEYPARSYAHTRLDYEIGTNIFQWVPFVHRLRLQPVLFGDGASIFTEQARDGTTIDHPDAVWKFSIGGGVQMNLLGIPGSAGQLRFDIARRLDREHDVVTYRGSITIPR